MAGVRWRIGTAQNLGGRSNQEDSVGVFPIEGGRCILALADGAGGHQRGEVASAAAIKSIQETVKSGVGDSGWLVSAVAAANRAVMELSPTADDGPRTTVVIANLEAKKIGWAHVGDSRLYRFRGAVCQGITKDDSVVQLLVDMKRVSEAEALHHPDRNRLLKALGAAEIGDGQPEFAEVTIGDGLVLCSDGVWEHVSQGELALALAATDLDRAARELTALAAKRGGPQADNASAILARLE